MRPFSIVVILGLSAALAVSACSEQEGETAGERVMEGAKDALNLREHEAIKDAMEDLKSAAEHAAEAAEEEAEALKKKLEEEAP